MSRLDSLISFMDRLESKSSSLLDASQKTSLLIKQVSSLHTSIEIADSTISALNETIALNYGHLHKFNQLHERSFYLESSISTNDVITNQTTWSNLHNEYQHIIEQFQDTEPVPKPVTSKPRPRSSLKSFTLSNTADFDAANDPMDLDKETVLAETEHRLTNSYSVSDIRLKPIRCREKKTYKKKSKYRLSQIYNINPLANSPILEAPYSDLESDHSPMPVQNMTFDTTTNEDRDPIARRTSGSAMDKDVSTLCTSPEASYVPPSLTSVRIRSNSVPELTKNNAGGLNIFNSDGIMKASNILNEYTRGNENSDSDETLRINRLKHFVSMHHGFLDRGSESTINVAQDSSKEDKQAEAQTSPFIVNFNKTPTFTPIANDNTDLDMLDIDACSDYSYYSPEKLEEDDFEKYLRRSRVDLNDAFPNIIKRSTSHDSVFSNQLNIPMWKFHNPIDNTASNQLTAPTIKISEDYIYYQGAEKGKEHITTNLLNEVIMKTSEKTESKTSSASSTQDPETPSKKANFSLFSPFNTSTSTENSFGKSFSESLMSLVQSTAESKKAASTTAATTTEIPSTPNPTQPFVKSKPIMINNPSQLKRMPLPRERTDGSHSKLIIGPNRTKILNHGESSYFKKPLRSKVSHNSLHEALNFSML